MPDDKRPDDPTRSPRIEAMDQAHLEARLREIASSTPGATWLGDLELRHLVRVVTECSLLLTDVYSEARIDRIMKPERAGLSRLVHRLIARERRGEGEVFYRVRRLPDDVRVVGDKALFDLGVLGRSRVKGYDLSDLGSRAYRMAGEVLELLAEDRRLRELFRHNRLLMLPLEEEVDFLRQCSDRFPVYAQLLRRMHELRLQLDRMLEVLQARPLALGVHQQGAEGHVRADGARIHRERRAEQAFFLRVGVRQGRREVDVGVEVAAVRDAVPPQRRARPPDRIDHHRGDREVADRRAYQQRADAGGSER